MRSVRAYRICCVLAALGMVVNFAVAVLLFFRARRPVEYRVTVQQSAPPDLSWTNALFLARSSRSSSSASATNGVDSVVSSDAVPRPVSLDVVDYGTIGPADDLVAYLHGRFVRRGSLLPWGVVDFIFPERIVFASGDYLTNRRYANVHN